MTHVDKDYPDGPAPRGSAGRWVAVILAALAVIIAAGVGGVLAAKGPSTAKSAAEQGAGATPVSPGATAPPSPTTVQPAKPAVPAGPATCNAADVKGAVGVHETNHAYISSLSLLFTNVSTRTCTIRGYGGAELYSGGDGRPIGIKLTRVPVPPPATVTLKPGGTAIKVLTWQSAAVKYDSACSAFVRFVSIILPDDTRSIQIDGDLGQVCSGGRVNGHAYG